MWMMISSQVADAKGVSTTLYYNNKSIQIIWKRVVEAIEIYIYVDIKCLGVYLMEESLGFLMPVHDLHDLLHVE